MNRLSILQLVDVPWWLEHSALEANGVDRAVPCSMLKFRRRSRTLINIARGAADPPYHRAGRSHVM
jgi:hypothetical protein